MIIRYLIIVLAGITGFSLSVYIRSRRIKQKPLVCFIGGDCDKVLYSQYAATFRIPNEIVGMVYYGLTALSFGVLSFVSTPPRLFNFGFLISAGIAVVFSLYLVFLQAVVLKKWCAWCVISSILSLVIFLLALY